MEDEGGSSPPWNSRPAPPAGDTGRFVMEPFDGYGPARLPPLLPLEAGGVLAAASSRRGRAAGGAARYRTASDGDRRRTRRGPACSRDNRN